MTILRGVYRRGRAPARTGRESDFTLALEGGMRGGAYPT